MIAPSSSIWTTVDSFLGFLCVLYVKRPCFVLGDLREEDSEEGGAGEVVVLGEDHVGDAVDYEDVFLAGGYTEECVVSVIAVSRNGLFEG